MLRKLAIVYAGAFLALSSVQSNSATLASVNGDLTSNNTILTFNFVANATKLSFAESWTSIVSTLDLDDVNGSFGALVQNSSKTAVANLFFPATTSAIGASTTIENLTVGDTYKLKAYATGFGSFTVNGFTATISNVPVPGPIAGAGLPAVIGLMGLLALMRQKRRASQS